MKIVVELTDSEAIRLAKFCYDFDSYFVLRNAKQADILQSAVERISEALSDKGYRAGYPFVAKRAPEDQWQPRR